MHCYRDHFKPDDIAATHFLPLTRLSSADPDNEGFFPTFGPAYVCFYGSPREMKLSNCNPLVDMGLRGLDEGLVGILVTITLNFRSEFVISSSLGSF